MGFHGDDVAAFVAIRLKTNAITARDAIRRFRPRGIDVRVEDVYLVFGDIDVIAAVRAPVRARGAPPATERIARWVSAVRERPDVAGTTTYIVVADPGAHRAPARRPGRIPTRRPTRRGTRTRKRR